MIKDFKTITEVEQYRQEINEACDKAIEKINIANKAQKLSMQPFNYIKEAFESLSPKLFETKEGKKMLGKYIKAIKNSKNLSSLQSLCEAIRKGGKDMDVDFFVDTLTKTDWNIDASSLAEDRNKMGALLAEAYIYLGKEAENILPTPNQELNTAINFIAENKISAKNIAEYGSAVKIIKENALRNENGVNISNNSFNNIDDLANELLENFNQKFADKLTIEEASALRSICSSNDREAKFNEYKNSCVSKITEAKNNFESKGDMNSASRLQTVLEQVNSKPFCLDTLGLDVCSLIELTNIFEEQ